MADTVVPATLAEVYTPALVLDRVKLRRNLDRMADRAAARGVPLRPHLKTAKSAEVAALAMARQTCGATVSTLAEAEYFFRHGYTGLFYAVALPASKAPRAAALIRAGARLLVTTDDVEGAAALSRAGRELGVVFRVLIEIDCGDHRCGVAPESPRLTAVADALASGGGARCVGICTHAGHSYAGRSLAEMRMIAAIEVDAARAAAAVLREHGVSVEVVSVGSSPTAAHGEDFRGITELRCGVYMFGDAFQAGIGTLALEDVALTVLTTVIARRPEEGRFLIDAGGMALSKDRATEALGPAGDVGYGLVADEAGNLLPGLRVSKVSQEHGTVEGRAPLDLTAFPVGRRLRILPNHVCMTAAAHDRYHVVDGGTTVAAVWPRINGW